MRDRSTTNWFGETVDEQEKRRQWLRDVYDRASKPEYNQNINQVKNVYNQALATADRLNSDTSINNDKYKHAFISCEGAQSGPIGAMTIRTMGLGKEAKDIFQKSKNYIQGNSEYKNYGDILKDSYQDLKANNIGINLGSENPEEDCDKLISKYYPKYIKY